MTKRSSLTEQRKAIGRCRRDLRKSQAPKIKTRKPTRPHRHKTVVLAAIPGTKGVWSELAKRLDCSVCSIQSSMRQEGWEFVLEAFNQERLAALDGCVLNVFRIAENFIDTSSALKANTWILEKLHPDFKPTSTVKVEGGDAPIQHQHLVIQIPRETLDRSVEERMEILNMIEEKEKELNAAGG